MPMHVAPRNTGVLGDSLHRVTVQRRTAFVWRHKRRLVGEAVRREQNAQRRRRPGICIIARRWPRRKLYLIARSRPFLSAHYSSAARFSVAAHASSTICFPPPRARVCAEGLAQGARAAVHTTKPALQVVWAKRNSSWQQPSCELACWRARARSTGAAVACAWGSVLAAGSDGNGQRGNVESGFTAGSHSSRLARWVRTLGGQIESLVRGAASFASVYASSAG